MAYTDDGATRAVLFRHGVDAARRNGIDLQDVLAGFTHQVPPIELSHRQPGGDVIVAFSREGPPLGVLGFGWRDEHADGATDALPPYLLIDGAHVEDGPRGPALMRRLLAMAILKTAGLHGTPSIVAARTTCGAMLTAMRRFASRLPGAAVYPACPDQPVPLAGARLARAIAHAIAPGLRLDLGDGILRGGLCAASWSLLRTATEAAPAYAPTMTAYDQLLAVIDLQGIPEAETQEAARRAFRSS